MSETVKKKNVLTLDLSKMKDSQGRFRTMSLFKESSYGHGGPEPVYTLKPQDDGDLISAKRIYLECMDVTEYTPAMILFGSWEHWTKLTNSDWFMAHLSVWRKELEVKLRSEAIRSMIQEVSSGGKASFQAAKFLAKGEWKPKPKVGRPTKDTKDYEDSILDSMENRLSKDIEALGLKTITN